VRIRIGRERLPDRRARVESRWREVVRGDGCEHGVVVVALAAGLGGVDGGDPVQYVDVLRRDRAGLLQRHERVRLLVVGLLHAREVEVRIHVLRVALDDLLLGVDLRTERAAARLAEEALEGVGDAVRAGADAEEDEARGEHDREEDVRDLRVRAEA
jgi:hypothetical protein